MVHLESNIVFEDGMPDSTLFKGGWGEYVVDDYVSPSHTV